MVFVRYHNLPAACCATSCTEIALLTVHMIAIGFIRYLLVVVPDPLDPVGGAFVA